MPHAKPPTMPSPEDWGWCDAVARQTIAQYGLRACPNLVEEDLLQEARLSLWKSSRRHDASRGVSLRQYAYRGVVGAVVDQARRRNGREASHAALCESILVAPGRNPEASAHRAAAIRQVASCLDLLRPEQRLVLQLRYIDGCTWREMTAQTGMRRRACRNLLRSATAAIRTLLREHGVDVADLVDPS
jgi:RNA polymerase sigma factor (sigma-70 family)